MDFKSGKRVFMPLYLFTFDCMAYLKQTVFQQKSTDIKKKKYYYY